MTERIPYYDPLTTPVTRFTKAEMADAVQFMADCIGEDAPVGPRLDRARLYAAAAALRQEGDKGRGEVRPPLTSAMDNVDAWRLGEAVLHAASPEQKVGDFIDQGLILVRILRERGYGIITLPAPPTEGQ
jgi:hypothetical protein